VFENLNYSSPQQFALNTDFDSTSSVSISAINFPVTVSKFELVLRSPLNNGLYFPSLNVPNLESSLR